MLAHTLPNILLNFLFIKYINIGDLHGNFYDLILFERLLWNFSPTLSPCNLLFLGDYIDRGDYGIEIIAYLFAYKYKNPNKIFLLRGNHEIREIQRNSTFHRYYIYICIYKF